MKGLFLLAKTDLQMAKNNLAILEGIQDDVYLNYIAYHVQQATEKILKFQLELLKDYDVIISEWATGTRYDSMFLTSRRQLEKVITTLESWFREIEEELEK